MKVLLNRLINHESISANEAKQILISISKGDYNQAQIASFLTVYMMRSITVAELQGFRDALLELCIAVDLKNYNPIDLCGTGGDGKNTFNISTLSSFVTAGSGVPVAKHGNYGVSSACGSSNVLEHLKVPFTNNEDALKTMLDKAGFCMMHAPLFHPAMANVAPIRKGMQVRSFFNMLGPIVNPSNPRNQVLGVFNLELARLYHYLFQKTDQNFTVLYALEGYDEISLTGPTKVLSNDREQILTPADFGVKTVRPDEISGGENVASSAEIFMNVIQNKGTKAQTNVVCANAGMAIATALQSTPQDGFEIAKESLLSGKAFEALKNLQKLSK